MTFHAPERYRLKTGDYATDSSYGNSGAFIIPMPKGRKMRTIAGDGLGWEHVSVSFHDRCPTCEEMHKVKQLFWDDDDCVVQYHPPQSDYVSHHPFCLHLWRPIGVDLPRPPSWMVGPQA
jgi:hypothetical protein